MFVSRFVLCSHLLAQSKAKNWIVRKIEVKKNIINVVLVQFIHVMYITSDKTNVFVV